MTKSYVTMEQKQCFVCGTVFDTGAILMDKRLKETFDSAYTVTGFGLCEEHQKLIDDGYCIVIVVKDKESKERTGELAYIKQEVLSSTDKMVYMVKEEFLELVSIVEGIPELEENVSNE